MAPDQGSTKKDDASDNMDKKAARARAIVVRIQELMAEHCRVPRACRGNEEAWVYLTDACRKQMAAMIPLRGKMHREATSRTERIREWGTHEPEVVELSLLELEWLDIVQPVASRVSAELLNEFVAHLCGTINR